MAHVENSEAYEAAIRRNIKINAAKTRRKAFELRERSKEVSAFLSNHAFGGGFLESLHDALLEWGDLTDGQYAAVLKVIDKRAAQQKIWDGRKALSSFLGRVGDRVEFTADVVGRFSYETEWGTTIGLIMRCGDDAVIWKGNGALAYALKGERVTFTAKVKKHDERKGEKQTIVTRPTKITINGWAINDIESNWAAFVDAREAQTNQTIN